MTAPGSPSRWRAAGRLLLLIAGIGLTTWGVCLVAFATSIRNTRLGIPIAFWGVLLGYAAIRGTSFRGGSFRGGTSHGESFPGTGGRADAGFDPADESAAGSGELQLRASGELVRERDQAARREYELQLELMLRRELEDGLREELAGLRRDVAGLRGDILDAMEGRLRLERVEITRVIGSNLAALQGDVRIVSASGGPAPSVTVSSPALSGGSAVSEVAPNEVTDLETPVAVDVHPEATPDSKPEAAAELKPAMLPDSKPAVLPDSKPEAAAESALEPEPWRVPEPTALPQSRPAVRAGNRQARPVAAAGSSAADAPSSPLAPVVTPPQTQSAPEPAPAISSADPFAGLPRLSSFRLPDLPPGVEETASGPPERDEVPAAVSEPSGYVGRRRHAADDAPSRGRHGADSELERPSHRR